ncbi:hypothetical protein SEVIR_1G158301v4 [Setaria viridis]
MEKKRNSSNLLAPSSLFLPSPPIAHLSSAPPPSLPPPTARLLADRLLIPASCAPSYLPPSLPTMPRPSGGQQRAHAAQPRTGACWGQAARPVPVREEGALRPRRAGPLGLRWFRWSSFLRAASTLQVGCWCSRAELFGWFIRTVGCSPSRKIGRDGGECLGKLIRPCQMYSKLWLPIPLDGFSFVPVFT